MNEEKTFNKLCRPPVQEMIELLDKMQKPPPLVNLGGFVLERDKYYHTFTQYYEMVQLLKQNHWEMDEFVSEVEKLNITEQIKIYNESTDKFPLELVERAKKYFPNARFVQAHIEFD